MEPGSRDLVTASSAFVDTPKWSGLSRFVGGGEHWATTIRQVG
jgi:hypothetical protein